MTSRAATANALPHDLDQLRAANEDLWRQLGEAQDALRAIREGEVDALVVRTGDAEQVFALNTAYELYHAFLDQMHEGAAVFAADGLILYANARLAEIVGVPLSQVVGSSIYGIFGVQHLDRIKEFSQQAVATPCHAELALARGRAGAGHVQISITAMPDGIRCVVLTDVTALVDEIAQRRQAQEALRDLNLELERKVVARTAQVSAAMEELQSFTYSVSHDLRSPLRAIDGYSRILVEDHAGGLDDEARRVLGVIRGEAQRMGRLITDLLALSRLGRESLAPDEIDMTALAAAARDEALAGEPGRAVRVVLQPLPPARGTAGMIRQVWVNLLANAVKFTRGCPDAAIEIGGSAGAGESTYWVKDNGAGFDMRYAGKLFKVFQRLHTEDEFEGTGVGLAIVHRIVTRHEGRVWAEGSRGHGASFYFTLPEAKEPLS